MQGAKSRLAALFLLLLLSKLATAETPPARPEAAKQTTHFLRLSRDKNNTPLALETAIMRFAPAAGDRRAPTVDLVAALHIADSAYYRQLNREFQGYDAVLYELVAPDERKTPKPGDRPSDNPISLLQNGMKDLLDLEFQLKGIDYTRKNMVHADMSPDQFAQSMRQRGESAWTMLGQMMAYALAKQNGTGGDMSGAELLAALFDKNRAMALKRLLAEQFQEIEGALAALDGPKGSTLISGRNKVVMDVLRKELAAGKNKIAIFYGAGHMPNFQKRLHDDFGMKPVSIRWLAAWNLKPETKPAANAATPAPGARNRSTQPKAAELPKRL
jgi:hypothetical protein